MTFQKALAATGEYPQFANVNFTDVNANCSEPGGSGRIQP
jgi:hypothetical protein